MAIERTQEETEAPTYWTDVRYHICLMTDTIELGR